MKVAVIRGTYAKACNAEVRETLGDNVLPYETLVIWVKAVALLGEQGKVMEY